MIYKQFQDIKLSRLGMGNMRLPVTWGKIDKQKAQQIIDYAMEQGINYYDTAYVYHRGESESFLGTALSQYPRESYHLATKFYVMANPNIEKVFEEQLRKLYTDYIDVLFLHNCDEEADLNEILNGWMYAYAKELKDAGRVGLIGLSSHNTKTALEAVRSGKIDVLMFPVNPLFNLLLQDTADARMKGRETKAMTEEEKAAYPSKQELYELCGEQGVPIVAMKPFAAGNILKNHEEGRLKGLLSLTPVQCISYILSFPQVACPVPGFANVKELNQSLAYLTASEEEKDFSEIQESLVGQFANRCMYCNHCQPCPEKIDIAEVTKLADMAEKEMTDELRARYAALRITAADCIHCGSCTKRCPFDIDASENMRRAQRIFGY